MALDHHVALTQNFPDHFKKIKPLKIWKSKEKGKEPSIMDPIGCPIEFYREVYKEINDEIKRITPLLVEHDNS